jgi:hypothetical protein
MPDSEVPQEAQNWEDTVFPIPQSGHGFSISLWRPSASMPSGEPLFSKDAPAREDPQEEHTSANQTFLIPQLGHSTSGFCELLIS